MTRQRARRWLGRLWPRKVRTRLTLIYAALFLAAGSALLGLTYGLVAAALPASQAGASRSPLTQAQYARMCDKPHFAPAKASPAARAPARMTGNPKLAKLCQKAYEAGHDAGSVNERERALHSLLVFSLIGLGLMTLASGGAGWLLSGRVLRPVRVITQTARRASEQHLGERIALAGARDELKQLADTFDDMLDRLDRAFAAQRRFVADASHELRTPLTVMRTAIEVTLAKPGRTRGHLEAMAMRVRDAVSRAEGMIDALLTLAVSDQGRITAREFYDLATAAEDAVDARAADIRRLGLRIQAELRPAATTGDPSLLDRMVGNLVDNAVRHNERGGTLSLAAGQRDGQAYLRVTNSGPVVPCDAVPSLFEPFHRLNGRSAGPDGAGLGLAIVRSVAVSHGAIVQAESRPAGGLVIVVMMPGARAPA